MRQRYLDESLAKNEFPYAIQCRDVISGATGTFLYDRIKRLNGEGLHAIGPVFEDTMAMFNYYADLDVQPVFLIFRSDKD